MKAWIHSIIAAAIGGAASALGGFVTSPQVFNTDAGLKNLALLSLFGAVVPVLALLKQSPLPASSTSSTTSYSGMGASSAPGSTTLKCSVFPLIVVMLLTLSPANVATCTIATSRATEVKNDGAAIAQAIQSIAALETEQGDSALAAQLTQSANALTAATANFTGGGETAILQDAATGLEVVLAAIPQTAAFAPLVPIAVGAIDALLANLGVTPAATANAITPQAEHLKALHIAGKGYSLRTAKQFKSTWNAAAKSLGVNATLK